MNRINRLEQRLQQSAIELKARLKRRERAAPAAGSGHLSRPVPLWRWLLHSSPRHWLALPFIYGMSLPLLVLHLALELYQRICFPLYKIALVRAGDHFVLDRHRLHYLNAVERMNCGYCGYANGLMSFAGEIIARTEQYWCPIKHSQQIQSTHRRYARFAEFGDAEHYTEFQSRLRAELAAERLQAHAARDLTTAQKMNP